MKLGLQTGSKGLQTGSKELQSSFEELQLGSEGLGAGTGFLGFQTGFHGLQTSSVEPKAGYKWPETGPEQNNKISLRPNAGSEGLREADTSSERLCGT